MNKVELHLFVVEQLNQKIDQLHSAMNDQRAGLNSESKSTAGDKHNTSRAMMHIEEEKNAKQLSQFLQLKKVISSIQPEKEHQEVGLGSLIETNKGIIYCSIPLGKINFHQQDVMVISMVSPIGNAFKGKKAGDRIAVNGTTWEIKSIC